MFSGVVSRAMGVAEVDGVEERLPGLAGEMGAFRRVNKR